MIYNQPLNLCEFEQNYSFERESSGLLQQMFAEPRLDSREAKRRFS